MHAKPGPSRKQQTVEPEPARGSAGEREPRRIYVRSVYPLNPGIPHSLDFPGGWE